MTSPSAFQQICQFAMKQPMLEHEEERSLIKRYREEKCEQSLNKLINSHMRLVVKMAANRKLAKSEDEKSENFQNGIIGLQRAIENFNLEMENRLSTHARMPIYEYIVQGIDKNRSIVRTPSAKSIKKVFNHSDKVVAKVRQENPHLTEGEAMEIAIEKLGVSRQAANDAFAKKAGFVRLDAPSKSYESNTGSLIDTFADATIIASDVYESLNEMDYMKQIFVKAVKRAQVIPDGRKTPLSDKELEIVKARKLSNDPLSLDELSCQYDVSRERIRQLEVSGFEKIIKQIEILTGRDVDRKLIPKSISARASKAKQKPKTPAMA